MQKVIFILLLFIGFSTLSTAQGVNFSDKKWEDILAQAKTENKLIFLDAYTTWCGPCKKMQKVVFPLASVGDFYNKNFINVKMDMEKGEGTALAEKYIVRAFPTFLFINGDGDLIHREAGYQNEAKLLALGKTALNPDNQLMAMKSRYDNGDRNPDFLHKYAYARFRAADRSHGKIAKEYLATQDDWLTSKNVQFIFDFVDNADSKEFDFLVANRDVFNLELDRMKVTARIENLVASKLDKLLSVKGGEQSIFDEADALFGKVYPDKKVGFSSSFKMQYYRSQGDRKNYAKSAVTYVENTPNISGDELNDIAWTFYRVIEDKTLLDKALSWSKRAVKLENSSFHNDTLASLYFKMGKKGKAKRKAKYALKLAEAEGDDTQSIKELLKLIEEG